MKGNEERKQQVLLLCLLLCRIRQLLRLRRLAVEDLLDLIHRLFRQRFSLSAALLGNLPYLLQLRQDLTPIRYLLQPS